VLGVSVAVDRAYPQLGLASLLNPRGKALAAQDGADAAGCAGAVTNAPFGTVADYTNYPTPQALAAVPQVKDAYAKLDLIDGPVPGSPSYWYNEINDELAIIKPVDALYAADCARGAVIDYYRSSIGEHLTGAVTYALPALSYLSDRFAGLPAPNTCPRGRR
jgi:Secretory lipase